MKRLFGILLVLTMITGVFAGCGSKTDDTATTGGTTTTATTEGTDTTEATAPADREREKIVINVHNFLNDASTTDSLDEIMAMDKYSFVDFEIVAKNEEYATVMPISVAGGEQVDIVASFNPIEQNTMAQAGIIIPLDDLLAKAGIDMTAEFGAYAENSKTDGQTVIIPHQITKWVMYYNKKVFDNAGVAYPDADTPMTWDEYSALAKQLTSGAGSEKIYGALHMTWPMFWYGEAIMALGGGEKFYNAEGLSNIEEPIFAKALQRTFDMQHVDESIPNEADLLISKTGPQAFMNGQYGMILQGAWLLSWAADKETYPRDWELGIAPMPVDQGTTKKTWGVVNGYGIAATSKNPELALEILMDLSRLGAKNTLEAPDANQTVAQDKLFVGIAEKLSGEGLNQEVIMNAFNNPEVQFVTEKVSGPNNVQYETVINEEVTKYFVKEQDLATTISNIKTRGDKAILDK